jgi:hypothetical protein
VSVEASRESEREREREREREGERETQVLSGGNGSQHGATELTEKHGGYILSNDCASGAGPENPPELINPPSNSVSSVAPC